MTLAVACSTPAAPNEPSTPDITPGGAVSLNFEARGTLLTGPESLNFETREIAEFEPPADSAALAAAPIRARTSSARVGAGAAQWTELGWQEVKRTKGPEPRPAFPAQPYGSISLQAASPGFEVKLPEEH